MVGYVIPMAIGGYQVLFIALAVLLLFGAAKIPALMRNLGRGVKEFKDGMNDISSDGKTDTTAESKKEEAPAVEQEPVRKKAPAKRSMAKPAAKASSPRPAAKRPAAKASASKPAARKTTAKPASKSEAAKPAAKKAPARKPAAKPTKAE